MGEKRDRRVRSAIPEKIDLRELLMEEILILRDIVKKEKKEDRKMALERRSFREQKRKEAEALRKEIDGTDQLAYLVTFKDMPNYTWFTFAKSKEQAKNRGHGQAKKYYFPELTHAKCPFKYKDARVKRLPDFDKYGKEGKVPIGELMKIGFIFTCGVCHKSKLSLSDLENENCTILLGEGDAISFASGMVICKECASKM